MRHKGDKLEKKILANLKSLNISRFRRTANSGARMNDGDLVNRDWILECKVKNSTISCVSEKEYSKLLKQAENLGKDWAFVLENKFGHDVVLLSWDSFQCLLEAADDTGL